MIQDAKDEFLQDIQENVNKQGKNVDPNMFGRYDDIVGNLLWQTNTLSHKTGLQIWQATNDAGTLLFQRKPWHQANTISAIKSWGQCPLIRVVCDISSNGWQCRHLVGYGLLLPQKDPELYWFAIRRQGLFMSNYTKGRVEILRMLKRRQTKDMLEKVRCSGYQSW